MTSLLYPSEIPNGESQLNDQFLTYQRLSAVIADSQLQILFDYTEERINGLRLNDRLSSLHTTLLRSGLQLFRLEMELATQDDSCEALPACNLVNFQRTDELGLETIATEIDSAKNSVNQCGQDKFLASYEVTILLCGLKLLEVEWGKFATGTPGSVQVQ